MAILQTYTRAMSDFKTLEQVAKEMEEERQKPRRPPQNAAEVNVAMIEYRRREREKLAKAQEQHYPTVLHNELEDMGSPLILKG